MLKDKIEKTGYDVSMLMISNKANYYKKATGTIIFKCNQGNEIDNIINELISSQAPQTILLSSAGINNNDIVVSKFTFEWSLKIREK